MLSPVYKSPIRARFLKLANTVPEAAVIALPSGPQPAALCAATASPNLTTPTPLTSTSPEQAAVAVPTGLGQFLPDPVLLKTLSVPFPLATGGISTSPFLINR